MSTMEALEGYRADRGQSMRAAAPAEGYVKEFTRHSKDVLLNLNELRHRSILTDTTLIVGNVHLQAHCAVLVACSGFFYSLYSRRALLQGRGGSGEQLMTVSLPTTLDPSSVSLLLDFMYTSRLPLTPSIVSGVLAVAVYLQMDHVAETCRDFMQLRAWVCAPLSFDGFSSLQRFLCFSCRVPVVTGGSLKPGAFPSCQPRSTELKGDPESPLMASPTLSPSSPTRSSCQPSSPAASETCNKNLSDAKATPDPKACNWKKYKYIVLNPLCAANAVKVEEMEEPQNQASPTDDSTPKAPTEAWSGEVPGFLKSLTLSSSDRGRPPATRVLAEPLPSGHHPLRTTQLCPPLTRRDMVGINTAHLNHHQVKRESYYTPYSYSGSLQGPKPACSSETLKKSLNLLSCSACSSEVNNKHVTMTSGSAGDKPYRCNVCAAQFNRPVAHLRAHVLIHTGEKPYPCNTCGTRFRHLQTLKSHLRIHTGEKPYSCEKCDLHFRHKSQLRLHLRQKHGAVTNTKIRYKVLTEPYQPILQAC
uniref:BCL6B transcription repressor n=1 Tax=Pundamilia nyererei TaxID=303518 RepID=A0A3B4H940_9CICH